MLSVVILPLCWLRAISVIILSVILLSGVMLSVVMMTVLTFLTQQVKVSKIHQKTVNFFPDPAWQHEHVRGGQQQPLPAHLRLQDPAPAPQRPPEDRVHEGRAGRLQIFR